ncbi:MAG: hypothetical protein IPH80_19265 [Myxococcales bacterium]|nr:hypothetical protein [Myxococcales bacterium]
MAACRPEPPLSVPRCPLAPSVAAAQAFLEAANPTSEEPAQPLPMVSEQLTVKIDRQFAESTLTQTFLNKTGDQRSRAATS